MIHYHGTPIWPEEAAAKVLAGRHAMVSFARPDQLELVADTCQTFALDNGAFSTWKGGALITDWEPYYAFVREWMKHPAFDFALIPDVIDGTEQDNDVLIAVWPLGKMAGCPIWHLHESLQKLERLVNHWSRVAIGSSGEFATVGTDRWWNRMAEAMQVACPFGRPEAKLHGLRMLDPEVFSRLPFASADSTNIAQNIGIDSKWRGTYIPPNRSVRGIVLAERIEATQSAPRWEACAVQLQLLD